ncbi:hypothetical protein QU487_12715 [Crenobacter sp. SG2305]|uniref:hypothetical protein n=1 Tax=Crenobacter oryzisoli TaxID=3056844 RepID=UPI0025AB21D1|nr:hypothetical protein [Crenobacter sp. SG2305]MDN0083606.1 hypothetical protein [Crenobacter sp. SG2305]
MYRLLRALTLIVSVAMLPMHATAMAAANPECSRMVMLSPQSADKPADCAAMVHKAKAAVSDVDCCSPHLVALPVSLPAGAVAANVPQQATCDARLADRCLSPPERPPRS